jgi:hypothetical protein
MAVLRIGQTPQQFFEGLGKFPMSEVYKVRVNSPACRNWLELLLNA